MACAGGRSRARQLRKGVRGAEQEPVVGNLRGAADRIGAGGRRLVGTEVANRSGNRMTSVEDCRSDK